MNVSVVAAAVDGGVRIQGRALDVTRYSVSLEAQHRFQVGALLHLHFELPGDEPPVEVQGVVVHHRQDAPAGVRYVEFSEAELSRLWKSITPA